MRVEKSFETAAEAANEKPNRHRDIQASRHRRKPDNDTIESCRKVKETLEQILDLLYFLQHLSQKAENFHHLCRFLHENRNN
jgi:hypothetical protein